VGASAVAGAVGCARRAVASTLFSADDHAPAVAASGVVPAAVAEAAGCALEAVNGVPAEAAGTTPDGEDGEEAPQPAGVVDEGGGDG